ncbi:MAG: AfsR/SARP family transcriptional regulator [Streptomycetales bacterium]
MGVHSGAPRHQHIRLTLLGRWSLTRGGEPVAVMPSGQRLLALLALRGPQPRSQVAGTLWPDTSDAQARASLRSTTWRVRHIAPHLVTGTPHELALHPTVQVDAHDLVDGARRLLEQPPDGDALIAHARNLPRAGELLPGWYDDWVLYEKERFHQLHVRALELLSERLAEKRRFGEAIDAALAAVTAEPYRESAHRAVMLAHLAEGNAAEAMLQYRRYRSLLRSELGMEPSGGIRELVTPYVRGG